MFTASNQIEPLLCRLQALVAGIVIAQHNYFCNSVMNQQSPKASWHRSGRSIRVLAASLLLAVVVFFLYGIEKLRNGIRVEVDWDHALQTIDGFGAIQASEVALTPEEADFFFSPSGVGLSIVRTAIIPSLQDCKDTEIYLGSLGNKTNPDGCQAVNSGPTHRTA